ncbi:DJ-1/PfpI family protein [Methanorbis rubei]|uniref:Protease YdeA n=1 Tax=Methanorbis rubei TaxID=3028300 RepID=A0AAE4MET9_9EURY|nr:putative protease YdeA [Methanocorpusculaceae archaeon Cs1]
MKKIIYVYLPDTMAEWELGNVLQAFAMEPMLCSGKKHFTVKTVGLTREAVKTLGGLTVIPDCVIAEMNDSDAAALLFPGAETWKDEIHQPILEKAVAYFEKGVLVAAACGATVALADLGLLNERRHTSNALEYLKACSPNYQGEALYQNAPAAADGNIITASVAGALLWAKKIIEHLELYPQPVIEAWYRYFQTGDPNCYLELIAATEEQ